MDQVLSDPQEGFCPLEHFLINRFHTSNFKFSTLGSKSGLLNGPDDYQYLYIT